MTNDELSNEPQIANAASLPDQHSPPAEDPTGQPPKPSLRGALPKETAIAVDITTSLEITPLADLETILPVDVRNPSDGKLPSDISKNCLRPHHLGDYELEEELGRGGMGVVFRARHRERGDIVALKILPSADGDSLHRFKREFRSLANISHPNLVGLRSLESVGSQWFFTMDLVKGARSIIQYVRPDGQLDPVAMQQAMLQLCEGLQQLHSMGILHRDLKPFNVVVDENGRVIILDFGLVSELRRSDHTLAVQSVSGTPAYMSPEAASAEKETFASDWYSFGVILYEAISNRVPFRGNPLQIMAEKCHRDAPPLQPTEGVSQTLIDLCMALVSRDASQRPSYEAIVATLGVKPTTTTLVTETEQEFLIGRETQMVSLHTTYDQVVATNQPSIVFVKGRSGEGKSSLVSQFVEEVKRRDAVVVLAGRCYDQEFLPFKALDSLIDALASYIRTIPDLQAALLYPNDGDFLLSLFPVLSRISTFAEQSKRSVQQFDQQQIRKRAFAALRELLRRLSNKVRLILISDDLQWGDSDSAEVLFEILAGEDPPTLMFIGSYRSDEAEQSQFLNAWHKIIASSPEQRTAVEIEVGPLKVDQCALLIESRLPTAGHEVVNHLAQELCTESEGNPYLLTSLIDCVNLHSPLSERIPLSEVIRQKLSRLPEETKSILDAIAVAGKAENIQMLERLSHADTNLHASLTKMRNERLVRFTTNQQTTLVDTYHDKVREMWLAELEPQKAVDLHRYFVNYYRKQIPELDNVAIVNSATVAAEIEIESKAIFDLALHARLAGMEDETPLYSLLAAEHARRRHASQEAIRHYQNVFNDHQQGKLPQYSYRILEGFSATLLSVGNYELSEQVLKVAREVCTNKIERLRILQLSGETAFRRLQVPESIQFYSEALNDFGLTAPSHSFSMAFGIALGFCQTVYYGYLNPKVSQVSARPDELIALDCLTGILAATGFSRGFLLAYYIFVGCRESYRYAPNAASAVLQSIGALGATVLGISSLVSRLTLRCEQSLGMLNNRRAEGDAYGYLAIVATSRAKYEDALKHASKASALLKEVGAPWQWNITQFHAAISYFKTGKLDLAIVTLADVFESSLQFKDSRTHCSYYLFQRIIETLPGKQERFAVIERAESDVLAMCNLQKGEAYHCLRENAFDQAILQFEEALQRAWKAKLPNLHVIAGIPMLVLALRKKAEADTGLAASEKHKLLKRAKKIARRGVWLSRLAPLESPFALREYGLVLSALGKARKAEKMLNKSCVVAKKQGANYEWAQSRLELTRLQAKRGTLASTHDLEEAEGEMQRYHQLIKSGLEIIGKHPAASLQ